MRKGEKSITSPAAIRGITENVPSREISISQLCICSECCSPFRWILARNRSFVSWFLIGRDSRKSHSWPCVQSGMWTKKWYVRVMYGVHDMLVPQTRQYVPYGRLAHLASNAIRVYTGGGHDVHVAFQLLDPILPVRC